MANSYAILRLYENVLQYEIATSDVSLKDIKAGVQSMAHVYAPNSSNFQSKDTKFANFNDPACRCAYLHKYAPLHTYMVQDTMMQILKTVPDRFREMLVSSSSRFKICSLGGGPGSDVIGVVTALLFTFGPFQSSVTIVDCMKKWEDTVALLMHELTVRPFATNYSNIWSYNNNCRWKYIECNLLNSMSNEVNKSIARASMVTMVKFVSAAICKETESMVDKIFRVMKPGALVLFIDNAAGGFSQIIERSGKRNGLVPIFGPLRHVDYESEALKIDRFGYTSCFKTKVTIILMQKLLNYQKNSGNIIPLPKTTSQKPSFGVLYDLPNNKRKIDNTGSSRSSQAAKISPDVGVPKKPSSSSTTGQNRSGISNKSISGAPSPSVVSNGTDRDKVKNIAIHHPFEVTNDPSAVTTPQKPASSSINGQYRIGVTSDPSAVGTPQKPASSSINGLYRIGVTNDPTAVETPQKPASSSINGRYRIGVTNDPSAVGTSQKPASSSINGRNRIGITSDPSAVGTSQKPASSSINGLYRIGVTNDPSAVGTPQKPAPSSINGRNRIGVTNESNYRLVRPSSVSISSENSPSVNSCLQPSSTASTPITSILANAATLENRISNVNQFRTPQLDSGKGSKRNNSGVSVEQQRRVAVVPQKTPTQYRSPTGNRILRPKSEQSPTVRSYQPVVGDQNRRDQRLTEVNDDRPEETGCSCCTIC